MKMGVESYDLIVNIHSVNMLNEIGCISRVGTGIFVQKCITIQFTRKGFLLRILTFKNIKHKICCNSSNFYFHFVLYHNYMNSVMRLLTAISLKVLLLPGPLMNRIKQYHTIFRFREDIRLLDYADMEF